jgi:hypothetical protein
MPTIPYKNKEGERVPGVTTVIGQLGWNKGVLMWWAWNEGMEGRNFRDTSQKAADAGTIGHYLIECDIKGNTPETSSYDAELVDKAETCYLNFLNWKKNFEFEVVDTEIHLVSEKYQFGGTPDCIGKVNNELAMIDWKTGNGVYEDHLLQLSAYGQLWNEYSDQPFKGGYHLLRITKDTASFHHHWWQDLSVAWKAFKLARKLYDMQKIVKKLK